LPKLLVFLVYSNLRNVIPADFNREEKTMSRCYVIPLLIVLGIVPMAYSETIQEIELTDGSIIRATVMSMSQGLYQLRSETLGNVEIPAQRIKAIRSLHASDVLPRTSAEPAGPVPSLAEDQTIPTETPSAGDLQQSLMHDPAAMDKVLSLQDDPLVQSILSDEETMRAIQAGDIEALLNDPRIRTLMQHPTVKALGRAQGR
jgi:hypothetical protein